MRTRPGECVFFLPLQLGMSDVIGDRSDVITGIRIEPLSSFTTALLVSSRSPTMPPKRKRGNEEESTRTAESSLESLGLTYDKAQRLIRFLLSEFNINPTPSLLEHAAENLKGKVSFSNLNVTYMHAASSVGLDPNLELQDISTFDVYRSRISTELFKSIVEDMDTMMVQYGPPHVHENEEARSRFFSPIFNHLVKQFKFMLRNYPETMITGQVGTRGRVEYFFKAFGALAILCIEMRPKVGNAKERLDAIGQVIAECDGCNLNNAKQAFFLPILCILSDGLTFEFFKFERVDSVSSLLRGCFPGDPESLSRGLMLPDPQNYPQPENSLPFICQLRCVCEMIFDTILNAYISALRAYRKRSASTGEQDSEGQKRPSFDSWDQALKYAEDALNIFRKADSQRKNDEVDFADRSVEEGFRLLNKSTGAISTVYRSKLLMTGWDENVVKKA